ncbi:L,D-transpeptidase family protein [Phreatobacter stygius]|uniref:L,D-transpeptidase family protein n=1 Tax=Phreatobacter stygius TaxID=1940610 RepID=UPI001B8BC891|nr:murein L,D-transpeptidase family protein [Phreatobacter stygius]
MSRGNPNRGNIALSQAVLEELNTKGMTRTSPVLMRIFKQEAELEVWKKDANGRYALFKVYPICNYSGDLGPKVREGDRQSPEGFYAITPGLMNPNSSYYLAFNMGFPNNFDRAHGRSGSHLMVHGDCSSRGCYAMTDEAIAEVYALARDALQGGQESFQVQAYPFRMTPRNLARHRNNPNMAFWRNLKEGYDHFEVTRQEPQVDVCERRYVFNAVAPNSSLAQAGGGTQNASLAGAPREMIGADPWASTRNSAAGRANVSTSAAAAVPVSMNDAARASTTSAAPAARAIPARGVRSRFTAVSDDPASRPAFQSASACPAYVVPPAIRQAVTAKNSRDMAQVAALAGQIEAAPARSGIDGGTNQRFADRFAHRRIRVGASEPSFSLASQESTPVTLVTARSPVAAEPAPVAPAPATAVAAAPAAVEAAQPTTLAAAPVPAPSPLRTTVIAQSGAAAPAQASALTAFAPAEAPAPQQSGNWFTRLIGTSPTAGPAPAVEATPAAQVPATGAPVPLPRPHASVSTGARVN